MMDKNKPCQEICGGSYPYRFIQNGKLYNSNGLEVDKKGKPIKGAEEAKKV